MYKSSVLLIQIFNRKYLSILKYMKLYLFFFLQRESESIKMYCIKIYLTVNPFIFLQVLHMLIIVHDCYILSE